MLNRTFIFYIYLPIILLWVIGMFFWDRWDLFIHNWFMSVTMALGSFIAGSTSVGGGTVAFPVMTLVFDISPAVARDFSLMIQAVGMTSAAVFISIMRIPVERKALFWSGIGAVPGLFMGYEIISPLLESAVVKTLFGSFVFSFGIVLLWINRHGNRFTITEIQRFSFSCATKLFIAGLVGGIISGILGSGIDIIVFLVLVLRFGVCEKIAIPTSVILMGSTAMSAMLWGGATSSFAREAWNYWWVCVPIVAFGAPFGAWCVSRWRRIHAVWFLCALIAVQYTGILLLITQTPILLAINCFVIITSLLLFWWLYHAYKTHRTGLG